MRQLTVNSRRSTVSAAFNLSTRAACARLILVILLLFARGAWGQEVGTIAGLEGSVEIGRAGTWTAAVIGGAVHVKDELRTGRPARLQVVFQDDSVLNIGDDSDLVIEEQVFDPTKGTFRSLLRLTKGKVRPLVSEYYKRANAVYEIDTPTALARVRGTEFVITYDPVADTSEVVGVTGEVKVNSVRDRVRHTVVVTAQELTIVARGAYPSAPQRLPDKLFRQYIEGLQFIGGGQSESMTTGNPLLTGALVPQSDRAGVLPGPPTIAAPSIVPLIPGEFPFESRTVADALGQPPLSVGAPGNLGINF